MSSHGRRIAFIDAARKRTYADTLERAQAVAVWLRDKGPVVIWARPSADWAVAFYGCVLAGVVVVPIDAGFSAEFVARVAAQTGATLVLTEETFRTFDALPAARDFHAHEAKRDDVAEIVFTSGTTSEPRGVTITHGNLLANLEPVEQEIEKYRKYAWPFSPLGFLNLIPLSHLFGQVMGLFIPQFLRGVVVFPESQAPATIAATIKKHRVSVMVSVPQQLETLLAWTGENPSEARGGVMRRWWTYRRLHATLGWKMWAFVVGGAALPPSVERAWTALGYAVIQGYGLTETAPAIAITHPFRKQAGAVGAKLAGVETQIASDGEILVRGANVSPSATLDSEGWLHTGDLGRVDDAGNLYYLGRKKDMIVTAAGLNVYPEDVERALLAQGIRDAAVVAKRSTVHAVVVGEVTPEAIDRANATLEAHQRVSGFSVWPEPELPRTVSTQKLQRGVIAQWVNGESAPASTAIDSGLTSLDVVEKMIQLEGAPAPQKTSEPRWPQHTTTNAIRAAFQTLVMFPLLRAFTNPESRGAEHLTQTAGPVIFIANHQTILDVPRILRALPPRWRRALAPAMSPDHFQNAALLGLTRLCFNGFLLSPAATAVQSALAHARTLTDAGFSILIFPEGRLTPDGAIHEFRPGVGLIAAQLKLPVVPMRLNADCVVIGNPIEMRANESPVEFVARLRSWYD